MTRPNPSKANESPRLAPAENQTKPNFGPAREIPEESIPPIPDVQEASYDQVLLALSKMDPLAQEVMIAQRLAAMPSQCDGGAPVNIPRMVRGPWAHHLRKLGIFCIPELATHELVAADPTGAMVNHTAMTMKKIGVNDMWDLAKAHNPEIANLVDNAKTPEEKQKAMRLIAARLPMEQRIALEKLSAVSPEDLEPK